MVLYAELAQYMVSALNKLQENHPVEIYVVGWDVNPDAPFSFKIDDRIYLRFRSQFEGQVLAKYVNRATPDLILCSGWMDKGYLQVCKKWRKRIPVVGIMDNHWNGSFKQQLARFVNPFTVQRWFSHAWVAGKPQKEYALKLGFRESNILKGVYTADLDQFLSIDKSIDEKVGTPHRFLYVGRYIERKGVREMWQAFIEMTSEQETDWELWCCGTGPLLEEAPQHPQIKHLGFVQPDELKEIAEQCSVFVLPSHYEPWGVVVHEFAAAGFALLCSESIGAATQFLKPGENGFNFKTRDISSLKSAMKNMVEKSDEEILKMGRKSRKLAMQNSPEIWADNLMSLAKAGLEEQ